MDAEFTMTIERLNKLVATDGSEKTLGASMRRYRSNSVQGKNVFINFPPRGLEKEYDELFTNDAIDFMVSLVLQFDSEVESLYNRRLRRKWEVRSFSTIATFSKPTRNRDDNWKVAPVGKRLENRHVDLGDVSPSSLEHFCAALRSPVQGIQVDFDDGHCPTWRNQILGLHNVNLAVHDLLPGVPKIADAPVLMLRPRAWNMMEKNLSINGRRIPGPLLDFALLIFHNGRQIYEKTGTGPAFYLSKVEGAEEAKLWNDIFNWTEERLGFPRGTVKGCVLIENILSVFEMDEILWELREHSLGLNCGIWDYAASIIGKFGTNNERFLIPDRNKYVNTRSRFLKSYMELVVEVCHKRGAHATGGMAANLLPSKDKSPEDYRNVLRTVYEAKSAEVKMGLDGFLIYDLGLVEGMNELWRRRFNDSKHQMKSLSMNLGINVRMEDILNLPKGDVTSEGLNHNICIGILFIFNWLNGRGHFAYNGFIEDSATAEISRSQVWQWIKYGAKIENDVGRVTTDLVRRRAWKLVFDLLQIYGTTEDSKLKFFMALDIFLEVVNRREFPEFITSYLNDQPIFNGLQSNL